MPVSMSPRLQQSLFGVGPTLPVPSFIIGRDPEGRWVALEEHGLAGGLFRDRDAAAEYASFETGHRPGAVRFATEPVSLRL